MVRRSTLTVLVVFALLVVGVAIGVTRWLRRKAKETTATESPAAKLSSQGGHRQVAAVAAHAHAHGSGTEASGRWSGLYRFTREEIERAVDYASSRIYLGSGSAGQVYQGVLPSGQLVAVKHIHRTAMSGSFTREVEQLCKVRHPNLVCLFGYCDEEGDQYLVYEYCANGNLAQNLLSKREIIYFTFCSAGLFLMVRVRWHAGSDSVLPWETRVKILRDCASVLRFLHTHPDGCIVHRDIKVRWSIRIESAGRII